MWFQCANRSIDISTFKQQTDCLKEEIHIEAFFDKVKQPIIEADGDLNSLMEELELSSFSPNNELLGLSRHRAEELYGSVMKNIAAWKRAEMTKESRAKESFDKQVEQIRALEPKDLLRNNIVEEVAEALNGKGKGRNKKSKSNYIRVKGFESDGSPKPIKLC